MKHAAGTLALHCPLRRPRAGAWPSWWACSGRAAASGCANVSAWPRAARAKHTAGHSQRRQRPGLLCRRGGRRGAVGGQHLRQQDRHRARRADVRQPGAAAACSAASRPRYQHREQTLGSGVIVSAGPGLRADQQPRDRPRRRHPGAALRRPHRQGHPGRRRRGNRPGGAEDRRQQPAGDPDGRPSSSCVRATWCWRSATRSASARP